MVAAEHSSGRRAELVPLLPEHYDFAYSAAVHPSVAWRWRFRGAVPSREEFVSRLWTGVAAQYLVIAKAPRSMAGLVTFYNYNPRGNNGYVAALTHPAHLGAGVVTEGTLLLIDYAFRTWDLEKVYFEALGFNLSQYGDLATFAHEEGRLRNHEHANGQSWDFVTLALYRDEWFDIASQVLVTPELLQRREAARLSRATHGLSSFSGES